MKTKLIFIGKKTKNNFFLKNPSTKYQKQFFFIFQLHQYPIYHFGTILKFKACKPVEIDTIGIKVAQQIKLLGCSTKVVKMHYKRLKDISTPDFSTPSFNPRPFNPGLFNHELSNPGLFNPMSGVEKSGVEKSGVEKFMVEKSGVEKSRVEMSSDY